MRAGKTLIVSGLTALMAISAIPAVAEPRHEPKEPPAVAPWPPVTTSQHAPHNWPVPHNQPAVNLNTIPSGIVFRNLEKHERMAVQRSLARVGYYTGEIDGIWGAKTWAGTRHYANVLGLDTALNDVHGSLRLFQHITN